MPVPHAEPGSGGRAAAPSDSTCSFLLQPLALFRSCAPSSRCHTFNVSKKLKTLITTITLAIGAIPAPAEEVAEIDKPQVIEISAAELWKKLKGDWKEEDRPAFIDLRNPKEYTREHLTGARHLDPEADDFDSKVAKLDRRRAYVVYCQDGADSAKVVATWKDLSFRKLYHLTGGWDAYEAVISGRR